MNQYHLPVMLQEAVQGLNIKPDGIYIDLTFGGGGHTRAILAQLNEKGKVFAFDQDPDAQANAVDLPPTQFKLIQANFRHFQKYLKMYGITQVDGVLADLGVSSHQIDTPERGFSTRFDADLDMRMTFENDFTAKTIIRTYAEKDLHTIFGIYGEIKNAKTLAQLIAKSRLNQTIETTTDLKNIIQKIAPRGSENKYFAQVFQALRIEVNDEMKALEEMLWQTLETIAPQGRLVVLAYHSLEDRLVKNFIQKGKFYGEIEKDLYGNFYTPFVAINKKPIEATAEEILQNKRARSAKLRIAERNPIRDKI